MHTNFGNFNGDKIFSSCFLSLNVLYKQKTQVQHITLGCWTNYQLEHLLPSYISMKNVITWLFTLSFTCTFRSDVLCTFYFESKGIIIRYPISFLILYDLTDLCSSETCNLCREVMMKMNSAGSFSTETSLCPFVGYDIIKTAIILQKYY